MPGWRMTYLRYTGSLWQDGAVHPALWDLLQRKDLLIEIVSAPPPYRVVLGIPHHAAAGVNRIAENWHNDSKGEFGRKADETTGLAGLAFFAALQEQGIACKLLIACHATDHDPNKTPGSPFWQNVFTAPLPGLLFELHGAGRERKHALELSAGRNSVADPSLFGKALSYFYTGSEILAYQMRPGGREAWVVAPHAEASGRLQNPALYTTSLTYAGEAGVPALHLEMKITFRRPIKHHLDGRTAFTPPPQTWQLARAAASAVNLLGRPDEIHISAADLDLPSTAFLTRPSLAYQSSYLEAVRETPLPEMDDNPELRVQTPADFENLVAGTRSVNYYSLPYDPPEEYLWLVDNGEFIGRAFFLHWLNDFRLRTDGQVDYWIRPSRRGQGYGKLLLRLLLERYRQLGLRRVLVTCLESNTASQHVILANGGQFESRIQTPDSAGVLRPRLRYWIALPTTQRG